MLSLQILNISIIDSLHVCPKLQDSFQLWGNLVLPGVWMKLLCLSSKQTKLMLFGGHFDPLTFTWPLPTPASPYPSSLLIPQQLLAIQEELNNKKSELEQAKEEQSHTQALLKVLQEQVSEPNPPLLSQSVQTLQTQAVTHADRAQGNLQETDPVLPSGIHNAILNHSVLTPHLL